MSRPIDRAQGKAPPAPLPFSTRPFGISRAAAAAIAAAAAAAHEPDAAIVAGDGSRTQAGGRTAGATGGAGAGTNLTTSTYGSSTSRGTSLP